MSHRLVVLLLFLGLLSSGVLSFVPSSTSTKSSSISGKGYLPIPTTAVKSFNHCLYATSQQQNVETTTDTQQFTTTFSYDILKRLEVGDYEASSVLEVKDGNTTHNFRVLVYPRGGGHISSATTGTKKPEGGFGMSYKVLPMFDSTKNDKVGIYLQYLPQNPEDSVDATFSLLLKGKQLQNPKFDLEWSSGMRFVAADTGSLRDGTANDFGAHLMQSQLLPTFIGVNNDQDEGNELQVHVNITIHPKSTSSHVAAHDADSLSKNPLRALYPIDDIRQVKSADGKVSDTIHDTERVRVGKIVVPVLKKLQQRPRMFELGIYPGVEYRLMRIFDDSGQEVFSSQPRAEYEMRPIYPLVAKLERPWPVRVKEEEIPLLLTAGMYNAISALGSLFTAVAGLTTAFVISQAISLFFIPSKSMDPTLEVGDVLLVEKVTPRLFRENQNVGNVVLFSPPTKLREIVASSGGRLADRDLFVKRIAAGPGDSVSVDSSGGVRVNKEATDGRRDLCQAEPLKLIEKYIQRGSTTVERDQVFVLGDCSSVSVDSRVWGALDSENIVGRPILRIWPLERFGPVPDLPTRSETDWTD